MKNKSEQIAQPFLLIALVLLMPVLVSCKSYDAAMFESNTKAELIEFMDGNLGQVVSIAIVDGGNVYQYHLGQLSNGDVPNNQTIYEIASITKTYTGLVVANAIIDGKVELDRDIRDYLKNHKYQNLEHSNQYITLRHLITHTSGLPQDFAVSSEDIALGTYFEKISNYSRENYFDDLKTVTLASKPGDKYQYSNSGTNLVAYILESVYQKPFELLVSEFITTKTGEKLTQFRGANNQSSEITQGADSEGNEMPLASAYWFADGGLTSTLGSMTRYIQYQLSKQPELVVSHQLLNKGWFGHGAAFYWNTRDYHSDEQMLYQSGGSMGTSSWLAIYPKKNSGIFIVTNVAKGNTQDVLEAVSNRVINHLEAYNEEAKSHNHRN